MIYDKLKNIDLYAHILNIEWIWKTLENKLYESVEKGKFNIESQESFFGIRLQYETKDADECLWEAHQKYLDIHVILDGKEFVTVSEIENMDISQNYDHENDYALFTGEAQHKICLQKGYFLVLYPNEVHKTAIKVNDVVAVEKIVFKQAIK